MHALPELVSEVCIGAISEEGLNWCQVAIDHISAEPSFVRLAAALVDTWNKLGVAKAIRTFFLNRERRPS